MRSPSRRWAAAALALLVSACVVRVGSGDPASAKGSTAPIEKILVFVVENHSLDEMRNDMPFTGGLADQFGYADSYKAITHPSLPNYLAIAGGSTGGVTNDKPPSANAVSGPTVFGQALDHGRTARVYADGMRGACSTQNGGSGYAVRHNPWTYHPDERAACLANDVGMGGFAGDVRSGELPNVGMVVPNVCHDAHNCSLKTADAWFRRQLQTVMAGPDWASGRLLVVVTADEDDFKHGNEILTTVANPNLHGVVVHEPLNHYSLSRALSEVAGAAPLQNAAAAPSLLAAFGLTAAR